MLSYLFPRRETTIHCAPNASNITTASGTLSIRQFIEKHCPAVLSGFKPSWWLPNGHAQTAYCVMGDFSHVDHVKYDRKYIRLPDGGTLGVDFTPPFNEQLDPAAPIIVVAHGLTGGSHESYVRHILATACVPRDQGGLGYRAAVLNFRGCAGVPITSPRFYSAAATDDYACGALYVSTLFPAAKLIGLGFSLGANVVTRYLGEEGEKSRLIGGCALACPWNLVANSERLEGSWFNRTVYSTAMGNNVLRMYTHHLDSLKQFQGTLLSSLNDQIIGLKNPKLIDVDELVVSQTGGPSPPWPFKSACDYYAYASSDRALPGIRVPFLAISADDDPIVRVIPKPDEAGTDASEWVAVVVTPGGGHLGWFEDGKRRGEVTRWVKQPVLQWVQALVDEFVKEGKQGARETEEVDGFIREVGRPNIGFKEVGEEDLPKGPNVQGLTPGL